MTIEIIHDQSPQKYGIRQGSNSWPLDLQSDLLPTVLRGPVSAYMDYISWLDQIHRNSGPEVIKLFPCSTQLSKIIILLIHVKMPTIVDILTFISMINTTYERLKAINFFICRYFSFYEQLKFHAHLIEHKKTFYNLGTRFAGMLKQTCRWVISPSLSLSWDCRFSRRLDAPLCLSASYKLCLLPPADCR